MRRGGEGRPREGGGAGAQSPVAQSQPMAPMGRLTVSDPQNGMMVRRIGHYCERRVEMGRCGVRSNAQPPWRSCRLIIIAPSRLGTTATTTGSMGACVHRTTSKGPACAALPPSAYYSPFTLTSRWWRCVFHPLKSEDAWAIDPSGTVTVVSLSLLSIHCCLHLHNESNGQCVFTAPDHTAHEHSVGARQCRCPLSGSVERTYDINHTISLISLRACSF